MDFGIGFLTNSIMLPILDFFFRFFGSYGLAIVLLTCVVKGALWPLGAASIRSMRKMQVVQPILAKRTEALKSQHGDDPQQLQQEQMALYKELGVNPLGGCLPILAQMPIFIALFATLRGTPFADQQYQMKVQVVAATEQVQYKDQSSSHNIYLDGKTHVPVFIRPNEVKLPMGKSFSYQLLKLEGGKEQPFTEKPGGRDVYWKVLSGGENVKVVGNTVTALKEGNAVVDAYIPGIASDKGFLFIQGLGRSGLTGPDGSIHWDIGLMMVIFGVTLWLSTELSSRNNPSMSDQQKQISKFTPLIVMTSFFFFPLPAGVFIYMIISNLFQLTQTFVLYREALPESIQRLKDEAEQALQPKPSLPFEKNTRRKKKK